MKATTVLILVLQMVFSGGIDAQDNEEQPLMERHQIASIMAIIMKADGIQDSFTITKEYFNVRGYRTKIEIFGSAGPKCTYEYIYAGDTLKVQRNTHCGGKLVSVTKLHYNEEKLLTHTIDYDGSGKETKTYEVREYNENKQLKRVYVTIKGKKWMRQSLYYQSNGKLKRVYYRYADKPKVVIKYDEDGIVIKPENDDILIEESYDKTTRLKTKTTTNIVQEKQTIIGVGGPITFNKDDEVIKEVHTDERGLVMREVQYVNGSLSAIKKYLYIKR